MTSLLIATLLTAQPAPATTLPSEEDDSRWAEAESAPRPPPSLFWYLVPSGLGAGALGLAGGVVAVNHGFLLGDGGGFLDLREVTTPLVFGMAGAALGAGIGFVLFHSHLADFNDWQRSRLHLTLAPPSGGDGWRVSVSGAF